MNKIELYNTIVNITQETGQGLSGIVEIRMGTTYFDELIDDGLIRKHETINKHLSDDIFYCLTEGYSVEFDEKFSQPYSFIREYLGIEHEFIPGIEITVGQLLREEEEAWFTWMKSNMLSDDLITRKGFDDTCKEYQKKYYTWLLENQHDINIMMKVEKIDVVEKKLTETDIEWIKSRSWFKEKGDTLINLINNGNNTSKEKISITNQLIGLYGDESKYEDDLKNDTANIKKYNKDIEIRNYLISKLKTGSTLNELIN